MSDGVARGAALGVFGRGWHLLTGLLLYAFLARELGPTLFGRWSVALSVLGWFEIFLMTALVPAATKAISASRRDDPGRLAAAAYVGQAVVVAVVFVALEVSAGAIAGWLSQPELGRLIRIAALDVPPYGLFMIASSVALGIARFRRYGVAWIAYATAKALFVAGLVALGFSVEGALVGNALSSFVGLAVVYIWLRPASEDLRRLVPTLRLMTVAAVPFLVMGLTDGIAQNADLWIVSSVSSAGPRVGWYASAVTLASVPIFLFLGLNRVLFPSVIAARAAGDQQLAARYVAGAMRAIFAIAIITLALTVALGRQMIELIYSARYAPAYVSLCVLMVAGAARTVHATSTEVLLAEERRLTAFAILGVTVLAEIGAVWLLAIRFGITGAAAGTAIAAAGGAIACGLVLRTEIGRRPLITLARAIPAAVLVGAVVWWADPTPYWAPVLGALALVAYLALLIAFGEFTSGELASVRTRLVWRSRYT